MKAIRWPGLIAFIVIFGGLIGGTLLFAETIVKSMLESNLTSLNKAKVDVASVDIRYSPLSLTIRDIQVADPGSPMTNSVQIGQARFAMSFGDLLLKKVIIDDMSLSGIRVNTPRKTSGAIKKPAKVEVSTEEKQPMFDIDMPDIDLPDVKDVLKSEPLTAEKLISELNDDVDKTRDQWSATRDDIKNQQRWDSHQAKYEKIKKDFKGNFEQKISAIKEAKQLRDELKQEVERIRNARRQFNADSDRLEDEFKAAKSAPKKDIEAIKQKYRLDNLNAGNITQMLFGARAAEYLALAQTWYDRIKPYIKSKEEEPKIVRSKGQDIAFREFHPKPGFYVAKAAIDAEVPRGQFVGSITDISSNQSISKKPTRFKLSGQNMKYRDSEELYGEINYIQPDKGYTDVNYRIRAYQLNNFNISRSEKLSLNMASSLMDLQLSTRLQAGELKGNSDIDFKQVQFKTSTSSSGSLSRMLAASFADVHRFNIDTRFSGSLHNLSIKMNSDLDNQIGQQLKTQLNARVKQFEEDLRARIDEKLREPMAKLEAKKKKLDQIKAEVDAREKQIKQQLADLDNKIKQEKTIQKQKLDSKVDKKKDELKEKLLNKLKL